MLTKFDFFVEMSYNNYTGVGVRHLYRYRSKVFLLRTKNNLIMH